jgi:tRNA-dihydrouridine synthase
VDNLKPTTTNPTLALAPMQDVTDLVFWNVIKEYGGADLYFTEYFRVYPGSHLNKYILQSVTQNTTGRPVVAQLIGNDIPALVRSAKELQQHPVAGIDLNLGCPAPIVYKKCAGGGLLRDLPLVDRIVGSLREAITVPFSVKTRIGFEDDKPFPELLRILGRHSLDLLTVHGRTVQEKYHAPVHYDRIADAVRAMSCPVLANGEISSAEKGELVLKQTGAAGLMIGRAAIRNPWVFQQFRQLHSGETVRYPTGREVSQYILKLFEALWCPEFTENTHIQRVKKHLNFLGAGVDDGAFLYNVRRMRTRAELESICRTILDHDRPLTLEPKHAISALAHSDAEA